MSLVAAPLADSSSRARLARSNADSRATAATVACVSLCALVVVAPFEAPPPLVTLPGQSLSSVEAALLHGIIESFPGFTPTYILIAVTDLTSARWPPHAHRI